MFGQESLEADAAIRTAAIRYLDAISDHGSSTVDWQQLTKGFSFNGQRVPLAGQSGIFRPKGLTYPISIRTAPPGPDGFQPYPDHFDDEGFLSYSYRGTDPHHGDNVRLRMALEDSISLVHLLGIAPGIYSVALAQVIVDEPHILTFKVASFAIDTPLWGTELADLITSPLLRRHELALVKRRVGQARFRAAVIAAYQTRCAICRLRRPELLDGAHIIPFASGGDLVVSNGLSMCKIHHAAYDTNLVGIRPDRVVEVNSELLDEVDGPMLRYGLQAIHGEMISVPSRPDQHPRLESLELRYEQFRGVA